MRMKKIRLDLDALDVVSFETNGEAEGSRGTVHGQATREGGTNPYFTLDHHDSCYGMCQTYEYNTCGEPSVGPSCEYFCLAQTVGCYPPPETDFCA